MKENFRWTFDPVSHHTLNNIPELILFGNDHYTEAYQLNEHKHEGSYEFVYTERGKVTWEVDNEFYQTSSRQIFHTRPDEWHRPDLEFIEPCTIWWMILTNPDQQKDWLGLDDSNIAHIQRNLENLPRVVTVDAKILDTFRFMRAAVEYPDPLSLLKVRHGILDLLFHLFQPSRHRVVPIDLQDAMEELTRMIHEQPESRWSVPDLAKKLGVSNSHVFRLFRDLHGQSPASYIERVRVDAARRLLLQEDLTITAIAMDLDFKTSQHFATVFKRYTGLTPSQWRSNLTKMSSS